MTTSEVVDININASVGAGLASSNVVVNSDCGNGYTILIGGSANDSNLYLGGDSTSGYYIGTSSGTMSDPSPV